MIEAAHSNARTATRTVALMYHAIGGPGSPDAAQDPHYTVEATRFAAQLDALVRVAGGVTSARDWLAAPSRAAVLTFDDGHASNHALAWPALCERGLRADFFVNPGKVGEAGLAGWAQLREMAASGMSIQSHGWNHRYFTELDERALREDLLRSRLAIEDHVGSAVTLLAPPGGRMRADLPAVARECGYAHVLGSEPGVLDAADAGRALPRMSVTASLDVATLEGWVAGRGVARARLRYGVLGFAKRALGDRRYERLRGRLLGRGDSTR
ncbi:peptidoglycan/xylan/chitin deacetylase (PgdA/CDA1 family) [Dokdonella fugitiva]|uniref:Peptidoglycan/xylan/chitin deacetylase (PgdA/CDA1 family) n=1 Tax=Dokdonella fugitiva TaxID=328517 RepID=A0A839F1X9_9GAMM|nr:polysaccharide deacetylase family protein [Dokdonella fugitiva]MBA8887110.1 peptidoglycan/xylan/chitin deacetylase (PgdA/CDA1 family) [Dokdonella fugitiva]